MSWARVDKRGFNLLLLIARIKVDGTKAQSGGRLTWPHSAGTPGCHPSDHRGSPPPYPGDGELPGQVCEGVRVTSQAGLCSSLMERVCSPHIQFLAHRKSTTTGACGIQSSLPGK